MSVAKGKSTRVRAVKTETNPTKLVMKALESPSYNYRTINGIMRDTKLPKNTVIEIVENNKDIRHSLLRAPDGSALYASKNKISGWSDFVSTIKALNNAKYGG